MTENPQITFVCCVESGWLEAQIVRLVESLRRWGGQFADASIIAVTPRFGPPLMRKTYQFFEKHCVEYVRFYAKSSYSWFPYLNKPFALVAAEERTSSEYIVWLDSDLLFLDEPNQLILKEGEDFLSCAAYQSAGTSGPDNPFEPYWQEVCRTVGLEIDDLPWMTTQMEGKRIRLYWNGGVLAYRRSTNFAKHYLQTCIQLFEARMVANFEAFTFGLHEQSAVSLTVVKRGLSWRDLHYSHDYAMSTQLRKWYKEEDLKAAKILHYHHFMWSDLWSEFLQRMRVTHPKVADWLDPIGPMKNEASIYCRSMSKILKDYRARQESAYRKLCRTI
jgi:hypothetical protein